MKAGVDRRQEVKERDGRKRKAQAIYRLKRLTIYLKTNEST